MFSCKPLPLVALAFLIAVGIAASTAPFANAAPPNIIFLLADDQRPDTIAALGNDLIETPNLDALARRGTTFTRAVCANPICVHSRAEMLTGASSLGGRLFVGGRTLDPQRARWAQTLHDGGYQTCYVGKWHTSGRPSMHGYEDAVGLYSGGGGQWFKEGVDWKGSKITGYRGWIFQSMDGKTKFPERGVGLTGDISSKFADEAIEYINRPHERPFFLHVNFTAPHDPLIMPPGYEDKYKLAKMPLPKNFMPQHPFDHGNFSGRDEALLPWPRTERMVKDVLRMYYAVISDLDAQIGRVLAALETKDLAENTIVIFSSDHGLAVGSHGLRGKQNMYEHTAGVPLIFSGPGIPRGEKRDAQVYLRDLFPTTCEMAGVEIPKAVEGRSLQGVVTGKQESVYPHVFCYFTDTQRMIRTDRHKLIYYPHLDKHQLFDLQADPHELRNLADDDSHGKVFSELKERLIAWQTEMTDPVLKP